MLDFFSKLKDVFTKKVDDTSTPGTLDKTDFAKLLRDGLMVGGAAIVTFFSEHVTSINFGDLIHGFVPVLTVDQWNMVLVPMVAACFSAALKFFKGKA